MRAGIQSFTITPARTLAVLLGIIAVLVAVHAFATVAEFGFGHDYLFGLARIVNFDGESTAPAWFSSLLLLGASLLLALIWHRQRASGGRYRFHWAGLAVVFLLLALDEAVAFHEELSEPVRNRLGAGGAFLHAWIIPYAVLGLLLLAAYVPFLRALPRRPLLLVLLAGALYVGGAMGMEMVGGYAWDTNPVRGPAIVAIMAVEETFEMVGLAVFIYALLDYLARGSAEPGAATGSDEGAVIELRIAGRSRPTVRD
ncbi:MAG TPA: hypothetical protein VK012_03185 [Gemmatimonadales bacterium]|nr:hypothetical protein [Gemmatimonadales bacterium]